MTSTRKFFERDCKSSAVGNDPLLGLTRGVISERLAQTFEFPKRPQSERRKAGLTKT